MLNTVIFIVAVFLAIVGVNLLVLGTRLWRGSDEAYEMNRALSESPRKVMRGQMKGDVADGHILVEHGIAFQVRTANDKDQVSAVLQAKLSSDSVLETLG